MSAFNIAEGIPSNPTSILAICTSRIARLEASWRIWRRLRGDTADLASLNDRLLTDIGLTRSERGHVTSRPHYGG